MPALSILRIAFCSLLLAVGCLAHASDSGDKWLFLTIAIYSTPLVLQMFHSSLIRAYGIWIGVFLALNALALPEHFRGDYLTLPPNMDTMVDSRALEGISGFQRLTTDDRGFRVTKNVRYADDAPYRIFAIGGSTTKQSNLDDRRTWTHLLEENLSRETDREIEVVNTGLHGLRAIHHLATMNEVADLNPDMLMFMVGINDWMRHTHSEFITLTEIVEKRTLKSTLLGQALQKLLRGFEQTPTQNADVGADRVTSKKSEAQEPVDPWLFERGSLFQKSKKKFKPKNVDDGYAEVLSEIAERCRTLDILCVFVTQAIGYKENISLEFKLSFKHTRANSYSTLDLDSLVHLAKLYNDYLRAFTVENRFRLCDLDSLIAPSFENFYDEMHFNEGGAKRVADHLAECVVDLVVESR